MSELKPCPCGKVPTDLEQAVRIPENAERIIDRDDQAGGQD
jgi:hypothetical protein